LHIFLHYKTATFRFKTKISTKKNLTFKLFFFFSATKVTIYERDVDNIARQQGFWIGLNDDGRRVLNKIAPKIEGLPKMLDMNCKKKQILISFFIFSKRSFILNVQI